MELGRVQRVLTIVASGAVVPLFCYQSYSAIKAGYARYIPLALLGDAVLIGCVAAAFPVFRGLLRLWKDSNAISRTILLGAAVIAVFMVAASISDDPKADAAKALVERQAASDAKERADAREERFQLAVGGALGIRKNLRDPDSIKVTSARIVGEGKTVCYEYRARNGFGGMNIAHAILVADYVYYEENPRFTSLWQKNCDGQSGEEKADDVMYALRQEDKLHNY